MVQQLSFADSEYRYKCQFGFIKARYRDLMKNDSKLSVMFALVNIVRVGPLLKS
jgi:IS5 family transposase